jgi:hypothetical protein
MPVAFSFIGISDVYFLMHHLTVREKRCGV